jgi:hypothetical protein
VRLGSLADDAVLMLPNAPLEDRPRSETMRFLLFHAVNPDLSRPQRDWENFLRQSGQLRLSGGAEQIAENVWLLPLPDQDAMLLSLLALARRNATVCRTLEAALPGHGPLICDRCRPG